MKITFSDIRETCSIMQSLHVSTTFIISFSVKFLVHVRTR